MRRHLSFSNVVSLLALFVALGGGAYAVAQLPRNSVGTAQLKANAVTSAKVKDGSLTSKDFKRGTLHTVRGPAGPAGPKGDTGASGATGLRGPTGDVGPAGADGVGLNGFFGTGTANTTISSAQTLSQDLYVHDLTVPAGAQINTNGYRIFVSGTLTLADGAHIQRDGNPGNQGFGGAALAAGTLGAAGAGGGNACEGDFQPTTNSLGGAGGGDTACPGTVTATPPVADVGGAAIIDSATAALSGRTLDSAPISGGAGGHGGNFTGGGSGGGVVVMAARTVVISGNASITANGGNSAGADSAGGGGGVVVVLSTSPQPAGLTLSAAPGSGGNATAGTTEWIN